MRSSGVEKEHHVIGTGNKGKKKVRGGGRRRREQKLEPLFFALPLNTLHMESGSKLFTES